MEEYLHHMKTLRSQMNEVNGRSSSEDFQLKSRLTSLLFSNLGYKTSLLLRVSFEILKLDGTTCNVHKRKIFVGAKSEYKSGLKGRTTEQMMKANGGGYAHRIGKTEEDCLFGL
ncbi:hypothetical protein NC653_031290 [Populus alba x Populus x berolinensis]|uniref:Uncharacterized protein n=1 Tax=Populus alba x Populus x berolinensis TaxID=444605 RepID=A0AAD6LXY9_9ROSI|nr:hypothetical protein NC653_031290 [Populus alba x Populus x berolinensis]